MGKNRLETFSDGVLAIMITIMVLELKAPHNSDFSALRPLLPVFLSYLFSFVYLAIYWNNPTLLIRGSCRVYGALWFGPVPGCDRVLNPD
jgi:uncharacterized membrane protein